jgi:antitoxin component of MazEF toxin-antitoxin module
MYLKNRVMKTKIVKMGNSTGICIPKIILEQCHMDSYVDIQIHNNQIVINPLPKEKCEDLQSKDIEHRFNQVCWYEDDSEWS